MAYKANVDDCRESPSFDVRDALEAMGKEVRMCDPLSQEANTLITIL